MSELIKKNSPTTAWLHGLIHLQKTTKWRDYNLILDISNPMSLAPNEKEIANLLSQLLESEGKAPLSTVINTIFPASLDNGTGVEGLIREYLEIKTEICNHPDNKKWGTYFMRMATRTNSDGAEIRPLEELIVRLRRQSKTNSPKHAWYELNLTEPCLEIPIYDNLKDPRWMMGGPCLSHLSFKLKEGESLILTAFYRSHYYLERTLGNLYGLALLQDFVAKEAGLKTAELVCHSSMAQIDYSPFGKEKVRALIEKCKKLSESEVRSNAQ